MASAAASTDLPLRELTTGNAAFGTWLLKVSHSKVSQYSYQWQGDQKESTKFWCTLISCEVGSYCTAVFASQKNAADVSKIEKEMKVGTVWRLSKVAFTTEKRQYVSSPFKQVIDLRRTSKVMVLDASVVPFSHPEPCPTVADVVTLQSASRIDLLGVVTECGEARFIETRLGLRCVLDVAVIDGSEVSQSPGQQAEVRVSIFQPTSGKTDVPEAMKVLRALIAEKQALCLMSLNVALANDGKVQVTNSQDFYAFKAVGSKAEALNQKLQVLETRPREIVSTQWIDERNYDEDPAQQSTVALLQSLVDVPSLVEDKVFQINFCNITQPSANDVIKTQDGKRLFLLGSISDFTGSCNVAIREKAALQLASCNTSEEFAEMHKENQLCFPTLASCRVVYSKNGFLIVEAQEQSLQLQPTQAVGELLQWLTSCGPRDDAMLAAPLTWLRPSVHYRVSVAIEEKNMVKPCDKALVLLVSTQRSVQQAVGEAGFRLVTKNVMCGLGKGDQSFEIVSMAMSENLKDNILDPPKTNDRECHALALVSHVRGEKSLLVEKVQILSFQDVKVAINLVMKLAELTKRLETNSKKRNMLWTSAEESPAKSRHCRKLSACPSDADMEGIIL